MVKKDSWQLGRMHRREEAMPTGVARLPVSARRVAATMTAKHFLLFAGYPRSGHSLVGQLLNAHPQAIVSHEAHAARLALDVGFKRSRVFEAIIAQELEFADRLNRVWTGYDYTVPGAWQGKTWSPLVIGDKMGGGTSLSLKRHPNLIKRMSRTVKLPIAVVHVLRNPLDNIATMVRHSSHGNVALRHEPWTAPPDPRCQVPIPLDSAV